MKVVDENESIKDIEEIIQYGIIEELIRKAQSELKLMIIMREWAPWDYISNPDHKLRLKKNAIALRQGNLFGKEEEPVEDTRETQKLAEEYLEELKKKK